VPFTLEHAGKYETEDKIKTAENNEGPSSLTCVRPDDLRSSAGDRD